ncbi:MAG TPA: LysM peptidoglycan-binding domain-containing protein [Noviherbaspirillum sp.]
MKKFSTAPLVLALTMALSGAAFASEHGAQTARCSFRADAPDQHTVVRGDTLWDISGRFLQRPWCWPQVWGMNRNQIHDPHWIYPGQIVYFNRSTGRLQLDKPGTGSDGRGMPTVKLSPQIRTEGLARDAIPAIPAHAIEPFLSQPLAVGENELQGAARIVATQEDRVLLGKGDIAYVVGDLQGHSDFQVFRPGGPLKDPQTGEILAYEAIYLGTAKVERPAQAQDEAHVLRVVSLQQEMGVGDRLLPTPPTPLLNYVPHPPAQPVEAQIMSIYGGVSQAGQNQIVSINRGSKHGVERANVLTLHRFGGVVADRGEMRNSGWFGRPEPKMVRLPDHEYGSLFVFRVFDNISYGLVMQVSDSVKIGDLARSPE